MDFHIYGTQGKPTLLLLPGLGVSHEIFLPLIERLQDKFYIVAAGVDGFLIGKPSRFTSVDDQAAQAIRYVQNELSGHVDIAYGLSLGGKILSRIMERNEIAIDHAIMDAAPLLPLPNWLVDPLRYYQAFNVWTCYHWMSAEKSFPTVAHKQCGMATSLFIPIVWSPSTALTFIFGMARKKPLLRSHKWSTYLNYASLHMWKSLMA